MAGASPDQAWLGLLECGEVEVEGRMPWSSNTTFLATVTDGARSCRAVYKPGRGERPLWDFPHGLYRRELAAYRLSEALGWGLVPPTVIRDGPLGEGSFQLFIEADFEHHYFTLHETRPDLHPQLRTVCAFDIVANSTATLAATVRNTGRTSVSLDRIVAAPGARFAVVGGGTCVGGSLLPPGASCTVNVRFSSPNDASETTGTLTVEEFGYDPISASGRLVGRSTTVPPPTTTTLPPGTETTTTRPNTTTTTSTMSPDAMRGSLVGVISNHSLPSRERI